jgi:hypothetical protein
MYSEPVRQTLRQIEIWSTHLPGSSPPAFFGATLAGINEALSNTTHFPGIVAWDGAYMIDPSTEENVTQNRPCGFILECDEFHEVPDNATNTI